MAHILIVDDDELQCALVQQVTTLEGHTSDTAADGWEALQCVKKKRYDLIILDRNMPRMSGINTLTAIRADPKIRDVKVIMCTSFSVTREIDEAFNAGANDYVLKPINIEMLQKKIQKQVGISKK